MNHFKKTLNITFIMDKLSTSRVFGADINDQRYFDLAKEFYERRGCNGPPESEFSPEFQKNVIFYVLQSVCITDKSEFSGANLLRSVNRYSHVRKYYNDVFVQVLTYVFQFIAENSVHVHVKVNNYMRIADPNCDSNNWTDNEYFGDIIVVHINFD